MQQLRSMRTQHVLPRAADPWDMWSPLGHRLAPGGVPTAHEPRARAYRRLRGGRVRCWPIGQMLRFYNY